jgi:hypothetical protein
MKMPTPNKGESEKEYIPRCISVLIKEGRPQDQAVAICHSMWKEHQSKSIEEWGMELLSTPTKKE